MDLELHNKVAVVTGASRGLGRAVAETLMAEGASIVAVARPSADLDSLAAANPERCLAVAADLTHPDTPTQVVNAARDRFGGLHILIVNTPGPRVVQPLDATASDFEHAFLIAFYPAMRLMQAARPALAHSGWGRMLIISSTSVKAPKPFLCLSAAARSALWAWAKSAAPELYDEGITVNALFAGPHATDRAIALGVTKTRIGQPEDFGRFVTTLCSSATQFVTGTGFLVDGGELRGL